MSQREVKKATQPVEAPGAITATQPFEAPGAASELKNTSQDASLFHNAERTEVQPTGPTGQPATVLKKHTSSEVPEELTSDAEQFSDCTSSYTDEGEASDLKSTSPDREDVDQELSAE